MSAFNKKGRERREAALAEMRERNKPAPSNRIHPKRLPPCPAPEAQRKMILWASNATRAELITAFKDKKFREEFNAVFVYWIIRTQIRALRLCRGWTQEELARRAGLGGQEVISDLENIYSPQNIRVSTLMKLARAFDVALIARLEDWGSLLDDVENMEKFQSCIPPFDDWLASTVSGDAEVTKASPVS